MGPGGRGLVGLGCSWLMLVMRCVLQVLIVRLAGLRMSMVQMAGLRLGGEVVQILVLGSGARTGGSLDSLALTVAALWLHH